MSPFLSHTVNGKHIRRAGELLAKVMKTDTYRMGRRKEKEDKRKSSKNRGSSAYFGSVTSALCRL